MIDYISIQQYGLDRQQELWHEARQWRRSQAGGRRRWWQQGKARPAEARPAEARPAERQAVERRAPKPACRPETVPGSVLPEGC